MIDRHRREDDKMTDDERLDRIISALMHNDDPEAVARVKHFLRCILRWYDRARTMGRWTAIGFFGALGGLIFTILAAAAFRGVSEGLRAVRSFLFGG